jgi:hypothetical protein
VADAVGSLDVARGLSLHGDFAGFFKQFDSFWRRFLQKEVFSEAKAMAKAKELLRNALAMAAFFALGYWLAGAKSVHASSDDVQFELQGVNENSSLLVYQPSTKTVYVYRGAMVGNSALQCNFMFQMTKPGGVIHRENCAVQTLQ